MTIFSRLFLFFVCFSCLSSAGHAAQLLLESDTAARGIVDPVHLYGLKSLPVSSSSSSGLQTVADAVTAARNGHFEAALAFLYSHLNTYRRDVKAHAETLIVLEWAQRYDEAVTLVLSRSDLKFPLYALKSVARSARRARLFNDAESFLQLALSVAPDDPDLLSTNIHLLADQGRLDEGTELAEQSLKLHPKHADIWLGKYYLHVLKKEIYAALAAIQKAHELVPSRYAQRELVFSLERCGMPQRALELLKSDPELVDADVEFRLRRAVDAEQIRWGSYVPLMQEEHYIETDQALTYLDALLAELKTADLRELVLHQRVLLFNRLVALRNRRYMSQVVDLWRQLVYAEIEVPDYALQAVADALIALQRPEESAILYADILERNPQNVQAEFGLYYSLHESNRYDEATQLINQLAITQQPWSWQKGYRVPEQNFVKFSADILAGLDLLYRNEAAAAERLIGDLYARAPHSSDLRKAFGEVQSARRRPRLAQKLFEQGLAVEPKHSGLQTALADSFMVRRQWRLAEKSISRLAQLYPDEGSLLRLKDEWQRYQMRILEGQVSLGSGDSPSVNGQEVDFFLRGWSNPLDYDWRLGAFVQHRRARLPEGNASRTYIGGSFQRLTPDWSWFGQLGLGDASNKRWYAELTGRYEPKDHWAVYFSLVRNGDAVPLRALEAGTGGTELMLGGEWWRHESLTASFELSLLDYDDGNQRQRATAALRKRFFTGPRLMLDNTVRLSGATNSQSGGYYFAPDADLRFENEVQMRWITWRNYADTFTQRASISSGLYWQQDYGTAVPFGLSYAHEWELQRRRLFVEYGPSFSLNHYDGDAESDFGFYLAFSWRY